MIVFKVFELLINKYMLGICDGKFRKTRDTYTENEANKKRGIIKSKKNLTLPGRNNPSVQLGLRPAES